MTNWLKQQIEWLKSFLSEQDGKGSQKRLVSFIVVAAFLVSYMKYVTTAEELADIPTTWAMLIMGIIGLNIIANKIANGKSHSPPQQETQG